MERPSCGTEVVAMDGRTLQALDRSQPAIANLSVTKSSRVHIGPKFVSVTQNVDKTEVVIGRILGLELVSPKNAKRLRCSIAVFVCWAFIVASALTFFIFYFALAKQITRLDLDIKEPWYLRRPNWQAMPDYGIELLELPVPNVIIGHSALEFCVGQYACIKNVLDIQSDHQRRSWSDIGPNFLIGGDGLVFEGRGANVLGVMVKSWNRKGISIMFLGNYVIDEPRDEQFDHVKVLLDELVAKKVLTADYAIFGNCQKTDLPFYRYIWNVAKSTTKVERLTCGVATVILIICITLIIYFTVLAKPKIHVDDVAPHEWFITKEMWLAEPHTYTSRTDDYNPLKLVIISHTVSPECPLFVVCAAELRNLQRFYIIKNHYDIPYNFFIGNDGRVYEGRGWSISGAHTVGYNQCSLGVAFIGDYREGQPSYSKVTELQQKRAQMLLEEGVKLGYLHPDFLVVGAKDLKSTLSPGANLYNAMQSWPHYDNNKLFQNRSCKQIQELNENHTISSTIPTSLSYK